MDGSRCLSCSCMSADNIVPKQTGEVFPGASVITLAACLAANSLVLFRGRSSLAVK